MKKYLKFVFGLRKYFTYSISSEGAIEQARSAIHDRVSRRQENFFGLFERGVFGFNKSPYLPLLESRKSD